MPLKFTVFGPEVVASRVPLVMVRAPAMPSTEPVDSCSEAPLTVTLLRLAVPFNEEEPVKVAVPAEAVKLPWTFREEAMEKLVAAVIEPDG